MAASSFCNWIFWRCQAFPPPRMMAKKNIPAPFIATIFNFSITYPVLSFKKPWNGDEERPKESSNYSTKGHRRSKDIPWFSESMGSVESPSRPGHTCCYHCQINKSHSIFPGPLQLRGERLPSFLCGLCRQGQRSVSDRQI